LPDEGAVVLLPGGHDAGLLASESYYMKIWELDTGNRIHTMTVHTNNVISVSFNDAGLLATGSGDNTVNLWAMF